MVIDWFTVIAQAINFLVLVWLLKRLLYKPILKVIDERQAAVAKQVSEAQAARAAAEQLQVTLSEKTRSLEQSQESILAQAKADAQAERERLLAEARTQAEAFRDNLHRAADQEEEQLRDEIGRGMRERVLAVSAKILADLASTDLEDRMAFSLAERLQELKPEEIHALEEGLGNGRYLTVRSSHELGEESRNRLARALHAILDGAGEPRFEVDPNLIGGVEVLSGSYRLDWSVADRLAALNKAAGTK